MLLGVQYLMTDAVLVKQCRELLGDLDRRGADQDWSATLTFRANVRDDRIELLRLGQVDKIVMILAHHRSMGGNRNHLKAINMLKLISFSVGSPGHAGKLFIQPEVVLEGDRRDGLVFGARRQPFLDFDSLMQTIGPAPARHGATSELVDDDDLAITHDVMVVATKQVVRAQRGVELLEQADIADIVQRVVGIEQSAFGEQRLDTLMTEFSEVDLTTLFVNPEITGLATTLFNVLALLATQPRNQRIDISIMPRRRFGGTGDDQWCPRLIDEDGIDFVDDCEVEIALHAIFGTQRHVVAQIIKTELVIGAVGDVAGVRRTLVGMLHTGDDNASGHAECCVDTSHPGGITAGQVVVDGDNMNTTTSKGVEIHGERRDQRLALTGLHLGNTPLVQHHAADQLNVEMAHLQCATGGLTHQRKGFRQEIIKRLARTNPLAQTRCLRLEVCVRHGLDAIFECGNALDLLAKTANQTIVATAKNLACDCAKHTLFPDDRSETLNHTIAFPGDTGMNQSGMIP